MGEVGTITMHLSINVRYGSKCTVEATFLSSHVHVHVSTYVGTDVLRMKLIELHP